MNEEPLMTTFEAAQYLKLGTETLRAKATAGLIAHFRSADGGTHSRYLFKRSDLDAYKNRTYTGGLKRVEAKPKR